MERAPGDSDSPAAFAADSFSHRAPDAMLSAPLAPLKRVRGLVQCGRTDGEGRGTDWGREQEGDPWQRSGGFGLADILNRSSASAGTSSGGSASALPLPKFSLPALHSFSKPLAQSELHTGHEASQRSILNNRSDSGYAGGEYASAGQPQQQPQQLEQPHRSSDMSPDSRRSGIAQQESTPPAKAGGSTNASTNSRRIAPAPVDDEEGEQEEELSSSIRGGRWTADEHERFLEGFRVHGHKWKRVQQVVRTRSVTQVRTHAQKYLLKLAKMKSDKKQSKAEGADAGERYNPSQGRADSSSDADTNNASLSSPDRRQEAFQDDVNRRSPKRTPRKKVRKLEHGASDPVDQEYIAAAATTLVFLMTQKIDSLFDSRHDLDSKDVEPYDCYSQDQQPAEYSSQTADPSANSRKRTYMHFITESAVRPLSAACDVSPCR